MECWCFKSTCEIIKFGSMIIEVKKRKGFKLDEMFLVEQKDVLDLING